MQKEITLNKCLGCSKEHPAGTLKCDDCGGTQIGATKKIIDECVDTPFEIVIFNKTTGAKQIVGFLLRKETIEAAKKKKVKKVRTDLAKEFSGALAQMLQNNELILSLCEENNGGL